MADSIDMVGDVLDFHRAIDALNHVGQSPGIPDSHLLCLKWDLVSEEFDELEEAIDARDVTGVADACADLIYVVIGLALAYGIDLRGVWAEVHRSNMAKVGGGRRADGKHLKPDGWTAPDVAGVLGRQASLL